MPAGKRELERLVVKISADDIDYKRKMVGVKTEARRTSASIGGIWTSMSRKITGPLRGMERQTASTFNKIAKNIGGVQSRAGRAALQVGKLTNSLRRAGTVAVVVGAALTAATIPLVAFGHKAVAASIEFESSFTGIVKTVNATEAQLGTLQKTIKSMTLRIPVDVNELNRIGESAGQLGIQVPNLAKFIEVMAKLGVTTNLASDQAASQLARLANITQMSQENFDRLGSVIVALGNNFATTEAEIAEMALRIAGAGHAVNLSEHQILSLAASLSSLGIEAEMGGSAISKLLLNMASAASEGGEDIRSFARAAHMSVGDFTNLVQRDAVGALVKFAEGLHKTKEVGDDMLGMLSELGIDEVRLRDTILRLAGSGDLLTRSFNLGAKAWEENNALTREANLRFATTASQLQLLKNRYNAVLITVGDSLIPVLQSLVRVAEVLLPIVQGMADAFAALPQPLQDTIVLAGGLSAALTLGFGTAAVTISSIVSAVGDLVVMYRGWSTVAVDSASMMAEAYRNAAGQVTILGSGTQQLTSLIIQQAAAYKGLATAQSLALGSDAAGGLATMGRGMSRKTGAGGAKRLTNAADDIIDVEFTKKTVPLLAGPAASGGLMAVTQNAGKATSVLTKMMTALRGVGAAFMAMGVAAQIGWAAATLGASLLIGAIIAAGVAIWKMRDDIMAAVEPLVEPFRPVIAEVKALGAEIWAFIQGAAKQMWAEVQANLVPALQELAVVMGGTLIPVLRSMLPAIKWIVEKGFWLMIQAAKGLAESLTLVVNVMRKMWDLVVKLTPGMANLIEKNMAITGGSKPGAAPAAAKGATPAMGRVYGSNAPIAAAGSAGAAVGAIAGMGGEMIGEGASTGGGGAAGARGGRWVFDKMTGQMVPESQIANRGQSIANAQGTFDRNFGGGFWWDRQPGRPNVPLGGLQKPLRSATAKAITATPAEERQARINARLAKEPAGFINRTHMAGGINRTHYGARGDFAASDFTPRRKPEPRLVTPQQSATSGDKDPVELLRTLVENTNSLRNKTIPVVGANLRR
jgi:TP901 family phage tail tape measure protein